MRIPVQLLASFGLVVALGAGQTRTELVHPAQPADAKPNDDAVPAVQTLDAPLDRLLVLRFKHRADLLAGLERAVREQKIRSGVILSGIGSVTSYHFHTVGNTTFPTKNVFVLDPKAPADIASMNGYVIDGRVHAHLTLSDPEKAFGGHLEPGTSVFTFAIVTVGVFEDGVDLRRVDDASYR